MSQENMEALRPIYEAWAHGDFQSSTASEIFGPDFVWVLSSDFPGPAAHHGMEASKAGFREWLRAWSDWRVAADDYIDHGDQVVVLTHYQGRGRDSGLVIDGRGAEVWTFRNGKVVRFEVWAVRNKGLEAAGLREKDLKPAE